MTDLFAVYIQKYDIVGRNSRSLSLRLGLVAALLRRAFVVVIISVLMLTACTPVSVKQMRTSLPKYGEFNEVYYVEFDGILPDWYRMYSVANGAARSPRICSRYVMNSAAARRLIIRNCSHASQTQLDVFASSIQQAVNQVELRFGGALHVALVELELYDRMDGFDRHFTHVVDARNLTFEMAAVYDASEPVSSTRSVVEIVAHELFHIARHVTRRSDTATSGLRLSEETRAELFAYCIENDVFGSIDPAAFDAGRHFDPRWFVGIPVGYESARGSIRASMVMARVAGGGSGLITVPQKADFLRLCRRLVQ